MKGHRVCRERPTWPLGVLPWSVCDSPASVRARAAPVSTGVHVPVQRHAHWTRWRELGTWRAPGPRARMGPAVLATFPGLLGLCCWGDVQDPDVGGVTVRWNSKLTTQAFWGDHIWGELQGWQPVSQKEPPGDAVTEQWGRPEPPRSRESAGSEVQGRCHPRELGNVSSEYSSWVSDRAEGWLRWAPLGRWSSARRRPSSREELRTSAMPVLETCGDSSNRAETGQ